MPPEDQTTPDAGSGAAARAQKLEQFLAETPALQDDPERRASFLLGALAGHVSSYQQSQGVSLTTVDQHPIDGITKSNLKRRAREMLGKDVVYSREQGMSSTMFAEVVDRLRESLLVDDPSDWSIGLDDLRFYYALGVTYGMNDASAYEARQAAQEPEETNPIQEAQH